MAKLRNKQEVEQAITRKDELIEIDADEVKVGTSVGPDGRTHDTMEKRVNIDALPTHPCAMKMTAGTSIYVNDVLLCRCGVGQASVDLNGYYSEE